MHGGVRGRGSNPPTYSIIYFVRNRHEITVGVIYRCYTEHMMICETTVGYAHFQLDARKGVL